MQTTNINSIKVSAIINTYNRFSPLLKAIESVKNQTHPNIELIIVNDKSSDKSYYKKRPENGIKWVDLEKSSREIYGFPSLGYTRNVGIANATGEYIAFLDDDDYWMPEKTSVQLSAMIEGKYEMSCSEGYIGDSVYNPKKSYPLLHAEYYESWCKRFFIKHYGEGSWKGKLPDVFDLELTKKHDFVLHSSVMLKKSILDKSGLYRENIRLRDKTQLPEDWEMWLRVMQHTDCIHINKPLIYYDGRLKKNRLDRKIMRKIKYYLNKVKSR